MGVFLFFLVLFLILWTAPKIHTPPKTEPVYIPNKATNTHTVYGIAKRKGRRVYVGRTNDFDRRKAEHFSKEYREKHPNKKLYEFMNEDPEAFEMFIIDYQLNYLEAVYLEATLIKRWNTIYPFGYNVAEEQDGRDLGYSTKKYNPRFFQRAQEIATKENKEAFLKEKNNGKI